MPTANNAVLCDLFGQVADAACASGTPDVETLCSSDDSGVSCDEDGHVQSIDLTGVGFTGVLPSSIGDLVYVTEMTLAGNGIQAPLPTSLGTLGKLQKLDISDNNLDVLNTVFDERRRFLLQTEESGIPDERLLLEGGGDEVFAVIGQLSNLTYLDISGNGLQGLMPDFLCDLANLQTLYLSSPTQAHANENKFTCVAECFYLNNPSNIDDLYYDFALPYCGQTGAPTVSPTSSAQSQSSGAGGFSTSETGFLIAGIFILLLFLFFILYYFTCYASTSVSKRDEAFMTSSSYIDIDTLRKRHLLTEPSIGRLFDEESISGFSDSDSDSEEAGGPPVAKGNRLHYQPSSSNINSAGSDDDDEMMKAWSEDLINFQNTNAAVLIGKLSTMSPPLGGSESSDDADYEDDVFDYDEDGNEKENADRMIKAWSVELDGFQNSHET